MCEMIKSANIENNLQVLSNQSDDKVKNKLNSSIKCIRTYMIVLW